MAPTIAVIGLGYVGLPLAVEFGKRFRTIGFDLSEPKILAYRKFIDPAGEVSSNDLKLAITEGGLEPTNDAKALVEADFLIIAVPTPVDVAHIPDFGPLKKASELVGANMKSGAIVVYESTVYPGATEEICVPLLEKSSGLLWKEGFHVAYSPERINPGDKEHNLTTVVKVVAGDDEKTLERVVALYESIITAGIHRATSISVAEAAKVIENTQRDLNIALMNELAIIFDQLNLNTNEVLEAAGTKWNFLKFKPGLVGGHCIGVDPYYLTHKAEMMGYHPQVILAGRRINDGMGKFVAEKTVKLMIQHRTNVKNATVIVLGLTFKENCADLRNSKVADVIRELQDFGCKVVVHDPLADRVEAAALYGVELQSWASLPSDASAVVLAVAHDFYKNCPEHEYLERLAPCGVIVDVKGILKGIATLRYWSL